MGVNQFPTFDEVHAQNPYLDLLKITDRFDPLSRDIAQVVRLVFRWSEVAEALERARIEYENTARGFPVEQKAIYDKISALQEKPELRLNDAMKLKKLKHRFKTMDLGFELMVIQKAGERHAARLSEIEAGLDRLRVWLYGEAAS